MAYPTITQVAQSVPFNNTSNGFVSTNAQAAIEESATRAGQARYAVVFGYNGNSTPLRYLDLFANVSSDTSPYIIAEITELISLSVAFLTTVTSATFTVYRNGSSIATLVVSNSNRAYSVLGSPVTLSPGDEISVAHSSGNNVSDVTLSTIYKVPF